MRYVDGFVLPVAKKNQPFDMTRMAMGGFALLVAR